MPFLKCQDIAVNVVARQQKAKLFARAPAQAVPFFCDGYKVNNTIFAALVIFVKFRLVFFLFERYNGYNGRRLLSSVSTMEG